MKPIGPKKTHPNWKLQALFKHAIFISKEEIFLGKRVAIDEEIMSCKGCHPDILRIIYKKRGVGSNMMLRDQMDTHTRSIFATNQHQRSS